jgi:lipoprotein-anchoring transpeptidase ErfK/SrfK
MMMFTSLVLAVTLAQATPAPQATKPGQTKGQQALDALGAQVALDRAGFSPGVIDGRVGPSTKKALEAYREANGGEPPQTEPTTGYEITQADLTGPFEPRIPTELPDQAKLQSLAYKDAVEALAEKFHTTPELLKKLNPTAKFAAGEQIAVPNVEPLVIPAGGETKTEPAPKEKAKPGAKPAQTQQTPVGTGGRGNEAAPATADVVVTVSKTLSALTVTDASGKTLMFAPVTTGSEHDPLPIGEWKVNGVTLNPPFRYNPDLFWDADPSHTKSLIKPGPNNPVGLVWIDLSKEHYGIHGSPEPSTIGRTQSHGCVRLTNWDAVKLAGLVKPGTKVVFKP